MKMDPIGAFEPQLPDETEQNISSQTRRDDSKHEERYAPAARGILRALFIACLTSMTNIIKSGIEDAGSSDRDDWIDTRGLLRLWGEELDVTDGDLDLKLDAPDRRHFITSVAVPLTMIASSIRKRELI